MWLLYALACGPASNADRDGDGLSDAAEALIGTDPTAADTDGDGLADADEVDGGSNPLSADSDGDGWPDGVEVERGSDPADPDRTPYVGNWPYNPDKDDMDAPGPDEAIAEIGERFARMTLVDQHNQAVDLYDFGHQDAPVLLIFGAGWCPPCRAIAAWLAGDEDSSYATAYPELLDAIAEERVWVLQVLGEDDTGEPPTPGYIASWHAQWPNERVPVLGDPEWQLLEPYGHIIGGYVPAFVLLDDEMRIVDFEAADQLGSL